LFYQNGWFFVEDLGGVNGVTVNGVRIGAPHPLQPGDKVALSSDVVFVLEWVSATDRTAVIGSGMAQTPPQGMPVAGAADAPTMQWQAAPPPVITSAAPVASARAQPAASGPQKGGKLWIIPVVGCGAISLLLVLVAVALVLVRTNVIPNPFAAPPTVTETAVASPTEATTSASPATPTPTFTATPASAPADVATETPAATHTPMPPTDTPAPPTDTPAPPTDTPAPPTDTPAPPTDTPVPPTDTPVPPTSTSTFTPVPSTATPTSAPLSVEHSILETRCLSKDLWLIKFEIRAYGGSGQYVYYRDIDLIYGPTTVSNRAANVQSPSSMFHTRTAVDCDTRRGDMMKPVEVVVLGAGGRGFYSYGNWILEHGDDIRVVAVAEPDAARRERFARTHGLAPDHVFADHRELFAQGQLAQGLINATMDRQHVETTLGALAVGYDVLLEKPMATTPHDCVRLVRAAESAKRMLHICHVMRYSPFYSTLYETLRSGAVGEVMTVDHRENVAYWHQAHSFVRGNWGNSGRSAPMILAKSCHDMDILFWLLGRRAIKLSAFGALTHFCADQAPPGAPDRCTDGCPHWDSCPYYAPRMYLRDYSGWPVSAITIDLSYEGRMEALRTGPYGRCVYRCDNDVVDHMTINMLFEGDVTVTFTMHAFSHENCRTIRYDGTRASLRGHGGRGELRLHDFRTGEEREVPIGAVKGGHGGGDAGLMRAFVDALRGSEDALHTSAREALESHLMAFAAEESRLNGGRTIDMDAYRQRIESEVAQNEA